MSDPMNNLFAGLVSSKPQTLEELCGNEVTSKDLEKASKLSKKIVLRILCTLREQKLPEEDFMAIGNQ
jgi:transcription initiation factor IIE alpha subunit